MHSVQTFFLLFFQGDFPKFCQLIPCYYNVKVERVEYKQKSFKPAGQSSIQDLSSFNPILQENRAIVAEICSAHIHEELNITPSTQLKATCHTVEQGPFGRNPVV